MGRSTFEGPVLAGDNRFGPLRNVGSIELVQGADLNFANTTGSGTVGYPGASGQFVQSNNVPNIPGVVYTPSATAFPPVVATPTADAATLTYRGVVFYLPYGSNINDIIVDVGTTIGVTSGALTGAVVNLGNQFNGTQYGVATLTVTSNLVVVGRTAVTYTGANLNALQATTGDITNPPSNGQGSGPYSSLVSQVVATLALTGTGTPAPNSGTLYVTIRYTQLDGSIGTATAYPYGNFD
jgi:hypothetical protein